MRVDVVGADVGGTKLAVRVETPDGVVRAGLRAPARGWEASPVEDAARWLVEHLASAVPAGDEIAAVGIGAQGCDTQEHCALLGEAVEALGVPAVVVNDAALLVPAAGLDTGIGIIVGTGSIGVGADADGAVLFAGGWGWVLGDEASAPAIVREATKAALAARDDGQSDDGLLGALLAHFGAAAPGHWPGPSTTTRRPANWGPARPAVFRAADAGSALAARVIDQAAGHLELLVSRLVGSGAVGGTVVAAGSVITRQARLAARLRARLAQSHPALTMRLLDVEPVVGGLVLARRRAAA